MLSSLLIVVVILAVIIYFYRQAHERPPNFPPGPPKLPLWGSYWFLLLENYHFIHLAAASVAKRYCTCLLGLHLGPFPTVVANSYHTVREVFTRPEFASRPDLVQVRARAYGQRLGIFFSDGQHWVEQKRFFLRNMRDFGFGRRYQRMEQVLREEAEDLVALGRGEWTDEDVMRDGCMCFPEAFYPAFMNLVWAMMTGERIPRERYCELRAMAADSKTFVQNVDPMGGAVAYTPWLRHFAPNGTGLRPAAQASLNLSARIKETWKDLERTFSENHLRGFIDHYIRMMRQLGYKKEYSFTEEQLQVLGADMLLATTSTTTGALTFTMLSLLHHPHVLRRCQLELDDVVGRDRLPTLDDREKMPYTEATIRESLRRNTMLPMAVPHLSSQDTKFGGYDVPKNTVIVGNTYAAHMDKEFWGDPENFRPERFIDSEGKLKKDPSMAFGAGKRLCPAETFSRQTMFVVFASLLQCFHLEARDPQHLPSLDDMKPGIAVTPQDLWVRLTPRC